MPGWDDAVLTDAVVAGAGLVAVAGAGMMDGIMTWMDHSKAVLNEFLGIQVDIVE